jgi:Domain of unknown function (DUF4188)
MNNIGSLHRRSTDNTHLPAWNKIRKALAKPGCTVGVWHEAYTVRAGDYEAVYVNNPQFGLGRVAGLVPAKGTLSSAYGRLGRKVGLLVRCAPALLRTASGLLVQIMLFSLPCMVSWLICITLLV